MGSDVADMVELVNRRQERAMSVEGGKCSALRGSDILLQRIRAFSRRGLLGAGITVTWLALGEGQMYSVHSTAQRLVVVCTSH